MAVLFDARGALRLAISLAALETGERPARGERLLRVVADEPAKPRLLAAASVDWLDRRDGEFWPFVRRPALWLGPDDADGLAHGVERLLRDEVAGFAFRSAGGELALQLGRMPGEDMARTAYAVEAGIDLGGLLAEASGAEHEPGEALSLFRFTTRRAPLVEFGRGLREELSALRAAK